MTTLADIAKIVQDAVVLPEPSPFIESRYPYTYSADFLRTHTEIIPIKYLSTDMNINHLSRADAAGIKTRWAEDINVDGYDLATVFADGYLAENGISRRR